MKLLVISGGSHPYEESTPILDSFLRAAGHDITVTEDASVLASASEMSAYDALVFNTMRAGDNGMTKDEQAGMTSYIEGGKGFVCIHISGSASEDWFEYYNITGGGWVPGKSYHPPYGKFTVNVKNAEHAGAQGISDFETNDEFYLGNLEYKNDGGNDVFLTSDFVGGAFPRNVVGRESIEMAGGIYPLGWTRSFGEGKVFVTLLGHNGLSFETPEFQKIVLNGVDWATS